MKRNESLPSKQSVLCDHQDEKGKLLSFLNGAPARRASRPQMPTDQALISTEQGPILPGKPTKS